MIVMGVLLMGVWLGEPRVDLLGAVVVMRVVFELHRKVAAVNSILFTRRSRSNSPLGSGCEASSSTRGRRKIEQGRHRHITADAGKTLQIQVCHLI